MKLFCTSDIHSYFTLFKQALDDKGFESNNPEHLLIVCGDVFDRGPESNEVYEFLNNLTNVVLIKGNHEDLMEKVWERGYCLEHDVHNGTYRTIIDMFRNGCDTIKLAEKSLRPFFDKMVTHFETKNYIFVHGWIPCYDNITTNKFSRPKNRVFKYNPNWRESTEDEWYSARWVCSPEAYKARIVEPNKTIVCGHWHTSEAHSRFHNKGSEWGLDACFDPFYDDGILMLDACTAYSGKVNVVVLEDELLDTTATEEF